MVGTPMYMSPEQAKFSGSTSTPAATSIRLGVLLYELTTGTTPFDEATSSEAAFDEMRRIIREEEPLWPSARISTLEAICLQRSLTNGRSIRASSVRHLHGEVDWIVMKCLEKDRNRRYDSANSLAADIERYLNDEPVQACPPSLTYRLGKFVRRHKAALATAGTMAAVLILGVFGLAFGSLLIWQANNEARRLTYFQRVALAEREWSANNLKRADELLNLCVADLRGWEWNYVKRLRSQQILPLRHDNTLTDCAVSPDGRQIVSLDWHGYVHWWDAITGRETHPPVQVHESSEGVICDVIFRPDGNEFATAGWDDVKVWEARNANQLHAWHVPEKSLIQGLTYKKSGQLLACVRTPAGEKDNASVWDPMRGQKVFDLSGLHVPILDMSVSPDDRILAFACLDNSVRLVDANTGNTILTFYGDRPFWCVSFSPDGKLIAAGSGGENEHDSGSVRIWEVASRRERPPLTGHGAQCMAYSPDGQRLATGGTDQSVKLWDITSGQEILTLRGHTDFVQGIAFTPDGCRIVSGGDRSIRIWDGRPWNDGERFGDDVVTLRGHVDSVNAVVFHPRLAELATASTDGTIKIWNTETWRESRSVRTRFEAVSGLAVSPTVDQLAVSGYLKTQRVPVVLLDWKSGDELRQLGDPIGGETVAFGMDGRELAVGNEAGQITIYDLVNDSQEIRFQAPGKFPYRVAFHPDGRLVAACHDNKITIWDTRTGQEIDDSPLEHQGLVYGIAFNSDGHFLASGGWDRTIRVWDTASWTQIQIVVDAAAAQGIAFSPDDKYLAWAATDSTVKLWHRTTNALHTLRGHLGYVRSVAFSPDGKFLASASEDGTAKIWKVPNETNTSASLEEARTP